MTSVRLLLVATCIAAFAGAVRADVVVYQRPHDLLVEAIHNGHAAGELQGKVAELLARQFKGAQKLYARAQVLHGYEREGCKRLRMQYTRRVATEGAATPQDFMLDTELNYCTDGKPPLNLGRRR